MNGGNQCIQSCFLLLLLLFLRRAWRIFFQIWCAKENFQKSFFGRGRGKLVAVVPPQFTFEAGLFGALFHTYLPPPSPSSSCHSDWSKKNFGSQKGVKVEIWTKLFFFACLDPARALNCEIGIFSFFFNYQIVVTAKAKKGGYPSHFCNELWYFCQNLSLQFRCQIIHIHSSQREIFKHPSLKSKKKILSI